MKFAYDVPGLVQSFIFRSDSDHYDSATQRFYDHSGYGAFGQHCEKAAGAAPVFTINGPNLSEGLRLDNSAHWQFPLAVPWEGTHLLVFRPVFQATVTFGFYPLIYGNVASIASNGKLRLQFASGVRSVNMDTPNTALTSAITGLVSGNIAVACFSHNQADRIARGTADGITVSASAAAAGATNGNAVSLGSTSSYGVTGRMVRLGNISGVVGDVVQNVNNYLDVYEYHTWKRDQLTENLPKVRAFIDGVKQRYAIA